MHSSNRLLGLVAVFMGVAVFVAGFGIDVPSGSEALSPRFFPQLLALVLAALGGGLCLQGGGEPLPAVWKRLISPRSAGLLLLVGLYTLSFGLVDFRLATFLFVGCGMWLMGSRNRIELCVTPLAVAVLVYALFRYCFMVLLPVWG